MKIKKYINYVLVLSLTFTIINCETLDYDETSFNRKETVFNEFGRSKSFLSGIYSYLPTDYASIGGAMRASASDEAEEVNDLSNVQKFNEGSWSANLPLDNVWGNMYAGIRASNVFLEESEGETFQELFYNNATGNDYQDIIKQYQNYPFEARFLRAFFYFELVKRYKNIPLVTTVLTPEEASRVEQSPFEDVVDFIVNECDAVAAKLPTSYAGFSSAAETGRATKGAALALKSRVLLYAASPLHNTNNLVLWQKAALAAKEVIDLKISESTPLYALASSYDLLSSITSLNSSSELIFERREPASNGFERRNFPVGYEGGNTGTCPTQNLVDSYEMVRNGLPIDANGSRYNPEQPYTGRDSRLDFTVLRNKSNFIGKDIETFIGGANGFPKANATKTGYYLNKFVLSNVNLDSKLGPVTGQEHTWIIFRYGEILLNYAEAMNEFYGPQTQPPGGGLTALEAVNQVRFRANARAGFLFPSGMTKDAFRTKLHNERRVELAFEDHRFWDVRRWLKGKETKQIFAMKLTQNEDKSDVIYEKVLLETREFEDKMNLYPIPQSEIIKSNNKLKQNDGW